jgi:hypothetical protein
MGYTPTTTDELEAILAEFEAEVFEAQTDEDKTRLDNIAFCQGLLGELDVVRALITATGVGALTEREQKLRADLKEFMLDAHMDKAFAPDVQLLARVVHSYTTAYDAAKLLPFLTDSQREICLVVSVDAAAVQRLVETGALDYDELVKAGALERKPKAKSLYLDDMTKRRGKK